MRVFNRCYLGCLFLSLYCIYCYAVDYPPQDHLGGDLVLKNGDKIWGIHTNISSFSIEFTTDTITVLPYDGASTSTGMLEVHADKININGVLTAAGSGYTGGGGGGGGASNWTMSSPHYSGTPGRGGKADYGGGSFDGKSGTYCYGNRSEGGDGGIGDGPYGGKSAYGEVGGYMAYWENGDVSVDDSTTMGSGGSGGHGQGAPGDVSGGSGGNAGGRGGGNVRLFANNEFHLAGTGKIIANGKLGGGAGFTSGPYSINGADGGDVSPGYDTWVYGSSGIGVGGGILIDVSNAAIREFMPGAVISSRGVIPDKNEKTQMGGKTISLSSNGGTVKLIYTGNAPDLSGVDITSGRYFTGISSIDNWGKY